MKKLLAVILSVLIFCAVLPFSASAAEKAEGPANVILMIGDGMGWNHLELAKQERVKSLYMEDACDARGWSMTRSQNKVVTDSAAGGTALSSGVRTNNRYVAVYHYDPLGWFRVPRTLSEAALLSGRRSGVITTDTTDGATPASFTAHTTDRSNSADITRQQEKSDFDLIWGGAVAAFSASRAQKNGFSVVTTLDEMQALQPGSRSFGQFDYDMMWRTKVAEGSTAPTLSQMTEKAISLLDGDDGFFLMVEGAHIDKWSHTSNEPDNYDTKVANAAEAVEEFDKAIRVAAEFAKKDGNTLVVITADHETGGLKIIDGKYTYTSDSHTGVDVPVIVFGSKDFIGKDEQIENRQVAQRIGAYMGMGELFPKAVPGKLFWAYAGVRDWFLTLISR